MMEVIYLLLPLALVISGSAIALFFWAVHADQLDDLHGPAHRVLDTHVESEH